MKTNYYSRIAALAAIVAGVGCAGDGTAHLPTGTVHFTGAETVATTSTASTTVPATGGSAVTTSAGAATVPSGAVAAGTTLPAGTNFAIVPTGVGFLGSILGSASISVNGVANSGATVGSNGLNAQNIALPVANGGAGTHYTLSMPAANLDTTRTLTVQEFIFSGTFYLRLNPLRIISPVPIALLGQLPNNGENAFGSFMNVWWNRNNAGRTARLDVDYGNGFALHQTRTIGADGTAQFRNFVPDASNIPATGVRTVSFTIGDLP